MAVSTDIDLLEVLWHEIEEAKKEYGYFKAVLTSSIHIYFLSKLFLMVVRRKLNNATDEDLRTLNERYVLSKDDSLWHTIFELDSLLESLSGVHFFARWFLRRGRKNLAKALREIQEKYMERFMDEEIRNAHYVLCEKK